MCLTHLVANRVKLRALKGCLPRVAGGVGRPQTEF